MKRKITLFGFGLVLLATTTLNSCKKDNEADEPQFLELTAAGPVSGTWEGNSIITITEDVVVPEGQSLTINAGAQIIFAGDNLGTAEAPEFQVRGQLYILGEPGNLVSFTVEDANRTEDNRFLGLWGGIQCAATCDELAINYASIEYAGAPAGPNSIFVEQGEDEGDPRYAIIFGNVNGKVAMHNSQIANTTDDAFRSLGGTISIIGNTFTYVGETGGEALNIKSGVEGDMAYNLFYNCATNGTKWSNSGELTPQTNCNSYNNTFINCGWRRNKEGRGGSINIEKGARGNSYNQLVVNCKYGVRVVGGEDAADTINTVSNYSFYFANEELMVDEFYPTHGILTHADSPNDVYGAINENNPEFMDYNVATGKLENLDVSDYDFHLQSSSPALNGAYTGFSPKNASLNIGGITYYSPAPSDYFGAFGTN